ncbi:MAG: beta-N-acetylhexosaminidase [Burkholderiaceae bacterium]
MAGLRPSRPPVEQVPAGAARPAGEAKIVAQFGGAYDPAATAAEQAPIVLDVAGTSLNAADRRRLAHPLTGGAILFGRNWVDRRQVTELVAEMKAIRPDLLVCVDHEGGRVQRFRTDGFTHLPPMDAYGKRWMDDGDGPEGAGAMAAMDSVAAAGFVMAAELRACGIDLSFAPVLDLHFGRSAVIGDRSFHRDARIVTMLARSLMLGMRQAGMAHCGKHFPGHGFVAADSHVDMPVDLRPLAEILADDARPYEWLSTSLASVMPAHVIYPDVDDKPAGFSAPWLQQVLRERLGFTGAIFSDDLNMAAARRLAGVTLGCSEAALLAMAAGCDLVLLCNQSVGEGGPLDELIDGLARARERGAWTPDPLAERRRLNLMPQTEPMAWDDLMHDAAYVRALERL